jgi:hypothetical protein
MFWYLTIKMSQERSGLLKVRLPVPAMPRDRLRHNFFSSVPHAALLGTGWYSNEV